MIIYSRFGYGSEIYFSTVLGLAFIGFLIFALVKFVLLPFCHEIKGYLKTSFVLIFRIVLPTLLIGTVIFLLSSFAFCDFSRYLKYKNKKCEYVEDRIEITDIEEYHPMGSEPKYEIIFKVADHTFDLDGLSSEEYSKIKDIQENVKIYYVAEKEKPIVLAIER